MNRDQIICPCLDITAGQIMDAYKEGAKSVEAIKEVTGAGRRRGSAQIRSIPSALPIIMRTISVACLDYFCPWATQTARNR